MEQHGTRFGGQRADCSFRDAVLLMIAGCREVDGLIGLLDLVDKRCGGKGAGVCSVVTNLNAIGVHE